MTDLPLPPVLRIEPASSCNFKCRHCPTGLDLNTNVGIMSMDTFDRILSRLSGHRFKTIVLYHGGEPLLNKNFFVMAKRLKNFCDSMKTVTNGSLLTEQRIDDILNSSLDAIEISLDGSSVEENNRIRVNANGTKILASLKMLLAKKVERNSPLKVCVFGVNIPKTLEEASQPPQPPAYVQEFLGDLVNLVTFKMYHAQVWPGMAELIPLHQEFPVNNACDHIVSTISIRWDGTVVPCCYDLTTLSPMGNILEDSLEAIWNNSTYQKLRQDILDFNPPRLCKGCPVLYPKNHMLRSDINL